MGWRLRITYRRVSFTLPFLLLVLLVTVSACADQVPAGQPLSGARPASRTAGTIASPPNSSVPPGLTAATVTRVVDGDTIVVDMSGEQFKLRYIGIDTPETVDPRRPVECFGKEASERNRQLVEGKAVGLEKDVSETDAFGRLLRYVWVEGQMVNEVLVQEGYALASTYPPDVKYAALFAGLQAEARRAGLGLWGAICGSPAPSPIIGGCEYSPDGTAAIKGNVSWRTGEKIYHVPGGEFYDATVIDEARGERLFCTEAEALAAGWRRSKR